MSFVSIVIPVWNGQDVLGACLDAVYAHSKQVSFEVLCVDNNSIDDSRAFISSHYPLVRLLPQPVNLGFAGAVNVGLREARGEIVVLLNQDCVVQSHWLPPILDALAENPQVGVAGCTILNPDGSVDHAGAYVRFPDGEGMHLTELPSDGALRAVEYVTGAAFALKRSAWERIGDFDEGFYPAYYEEADYCYRGHVLGIATVCVPDSRVVHMHSNQGWKLDPMKHAVNHHRSRYRFVVKHYASSQVQPFLEAERQTIDRETVYPQALARAVAARATLHNLQDILWRRGADRKEVVPPTLRRQFQNAFISIMQTALANRGTLAPATLSSMQQEFALAEDRLLEDARSEEYSLLTRIYFRSPSDQDVESFLHRLWRRMVLRLLSFLIGRDYLLQSQLNALHVKRMDRLERWVNWRLTVLESLVKYED